MSQNAGTDSCDAIFTCPQEVTVDGRDVGIVAGVMSNGLHDVLEVRAGEREHLIPVVSEVVRAIDRAGRRVRIDPLPGLLD